MSKVFVEYNTGDEIYVRGRIESAEVIEGKVFYKIQQSTELIPQDIIEGVALKNAKIVISGVDCGELEEKLKELEESAEKARSIMEDLAKKEFEVKVKPSIA